MGRPRKREEEIPLRKCLHCGKGLEDKNFYKSNGNIYAGNDNYLPICKDFMKILFEQYRIRYRNQFSVLGMQSEEMEIEKLTIKRLCMAFDIYYSDRLFDAALKQMEKFSNLDLITAYMKIVNLRQNKNKSYDDTIIEGNLSQELLKSSMASKMRKKFDDGADNEIYSDIYNLCIKLIQSLRGKVNLE